MSTPTPDYGEPWQKRAEWLNCPFCNREGAIIDLELDRILACVNALAGVPDPAAELARLRETLNSFDAVDKERNDALKTCMTLLENMHANRNQHKVAAYTDEIEAAMAQIKTCYDPHA